MRAGGFVVQSANDGTFRVDRFEPEVEVRIDALGFAPWHRKVPCAERSGIARIILEPAELLRGRLLRDDGAALTEAEVHLEWGPDDGSLRRSTLELELVDGSFRFVLPAPGSYRVSVSAPGLQRLELGEWHLAAGTEVDSGNWVLDSGAAVEGRFLDRETGAPVGGARVEVVPVGRAWIAAALRGEGHRAASDAEGVFSVSGLEPGRYAVTYSVPKGQRGLRIVTLTRRERLDLGSIWTDAGVALEGRVLQRDGVPVAAVMVHLYDVAAEMLDPFAEAITAPDGSFRIPALAVGEYLLRIGAPGVQYSALHQATRPTASREIVLSGVRLRGRALREGLPMGGATLVLEANEDRSKSRQKVVVEDRREGASSRRLLGAGTTRCEVTTSASGEFSCDGVLPGTVSATFLEGRAELHRFLEVPDAEEAAFELDFGGTDLAGVVRGSAGAATAAAIVSAIDAQGRPLSRALAGEGGAFALRGLPDQPLRIEAKDFSGGRAEQGPVSPREVGGPIVLDLAQGSERDVEVELRGSDEHGRPQPELVLLGPSGELVEGAMVRGTRAQLRGVQPGTYWLAWDDSIYGAGSRPLTLDAGGKTARVSLTLEPGGALLLECDALRHAGAPIRALRVLTKEGGDVTPFLTGVVPGLRFSEDCRLVLGRLSAGRYEIEVEAGEEQSRRAFSLRDGDEMALRFP